MTIFVRFALYPIHGGEKRSRDPRGILEEAQGLAEKGYKQVTLLGQNVNSYHFEDWDFARLIIALAEVPGVETGFDSCLRILRTFLLLYSMPWLSIQKYARTFIYLFNLVMIEF